MYTICTFVWQLLMPEHASPSSIKIHVSLQILINIESLLFYHQLGTSRTLTLNFNKKHDILLSYIANDLIPTRRSFLTRKLQHFASHYKMNRDLIRCFKTQRKEDSITFILNLKSSEFKRPDLNYLGPDFLSQDVTIFIRDRKVKSEGKCVVL